MRRHAPLTAQLAVGIVTLALMLTGVQIWSVATAPVARADGAATGVSGQFVPVAGRLLDTRTGTGGYNTPMPPVSSGASAWRTVQVEGRLGVPSSGVAAVEIALTAINQTGQGVASVRPADGAGVYSALVYGSNTSEALTNTVTVALAHDGTFQVAVETQTDLSIDLEGYYTAATSGAGYVPMTPATLIDSRSNLGIGTHPVAPANTYTVTVAGQAGIPAGATAVAVNFQVLSYSTGGGFLNAYAADTGLAPSMSFPGSAITAIGGIVSLGTSATAAGKIKIAWQGVGTADIVMTVVGYFVGNAGPGQAGMFTPGAARVLTEATIPGNTSAVVPVAGIAGVPAAGSGIGSVVLNVQVIHHDANQGIVYVAPDDRSFANVGVLVYAPNSIRSNMATVQLGADGGIRVINNAADTVQVTLDVEGWYYSATGAVPSGQNVTQRYVTVQGSKYGGPWVTYKYRSGTSGTFSQVPTAQLTDSSGNHPAAWPVTTSGSPAAYTPYTWDMSAQFGAAATGKTLVQVEACYGTSQSTADASLACSTPFNVSYSPSDFGASNATAEMGPGSLSLLTGDYELSVTDAAAATSIGGLSVGRTLTTLSPAVGNPLTGTTGVSATGVFGPGWAADLTGSDAGDATLTVQDVHLLGYLLFTDTDGGQETYQATSSIAAFPIHFDAVGDDAGDGVTVTMTNQTTITMADPDGTVTTWTRPSGATAWQVQSVVETGSHDTTTYAWDGAVVRRILAPTPAGVTCTDATADTTVGCRSLVLIYNAAKTRVTEIDASLPKVGGQSNKVAVAHYDYDATGRLIDSYDPRVTPHLVTTYSYGGDNRIATVTPPGENSWSFGYDGSGRLSTVSRQTPVTDPATGVTSSQTAVETAVYGVPLSGTGRPNVTADKAAGWDETTDLPLTGTAIFDPDHRPASTDAGSVGTGEWPYATIHYLDVNGREVNTATNGAGQWLIDTTQFDNNGNDFWDLDAGNRAQALNPVSGTTDAFVAGQASSSTRAGLLASTTIYNPLDPSEVTDAYGPTHPVTLSTGALIHARTHVSTTYDQNAPGATNPATGAPYRLPTKVVTVPFDVDTGADAAYPDRSTTVAGYAAVGGMSGYTGWSLGVPTTSTVQMGASPSSSDLTTTTVYDADGRVVQTRLPGDSGGTTPRTTDTGYYTATGAGACVNAAFAGLVCQTSPGAQPSSGAALAVVTDTYDQWGDVLTQTSKYLNTATTTKTTTNAYDAAGRLLVSGTVVTPEPAGDTGLPAITTTYDPATGQVATTSTGGSGGTKTLGTTYNSVGAVSTYSDATGNVTTTGYDIEGRPVRQSDSKGTVTLQYDGGGEHRGLVTSEDIGTSSDSSFTAVYDASGDLATLTYPGGLTATRSYDNAGNPTGLAYTKAGATLLAFSQTYGDASTGEDHIVAQASKVNGTAYSSQKFTDDAAGRLTTVADTYDGACTTRLYGFNADSDRTSLASYSAAADGSCSSSGGGTLVLSSYDDADRLRSESTYGSSNYTSTYDYDVLGRTSTVPAADAVGVGSHHAAAGDMGLGYYSNDMVASQTQGSGDDATTIAFGLDPDQDRILTEATTTSSGTKTLTNHYDDASDETAWASTLKPDGTTVTKRYVDGIDGNLAAVVADDGTVKLDLSNLHGDTVATIDPTATSIGNYHESTEYGLPRDPATAADDYGWLGGKKRSSDDLGGLTLMGVRLYNPATGRFGSVDPIPGGNANAYTYPTDPINGYDLTGKTTRQMDDTNPPKSKKAKKKSRCGVNCHASRFSQHLNASYAGCATVCVSASYQGGHGTGAVGCCGQGGLGPSLGATSAKAKDQGKNSFSFCFSLGVGGCLAEGHKIGGGKWYGASVTYGDGFQIGGFHNVADAHVNKHFPFLHVKLGW